MKRTTLAFLLHLNLAACMSLCAMEFNVDLPLRSDGMGGTEATNLGKIDVGATFTGRTLPEKNFVELISSGDSVVCGTGAGEVNTGTVAVDFKLLPNSKPGSVLLSARGQGNGYPLLIIAHKDADGWYLEANLRTWQGTGWRIIKFDNKATRSDIAKGWNTLAVTWSPQGIALWLNNKQVAHDPSAITVNQFWRLGVGDVPVVGNQDAGNSLLACYANLLFAPGLLDCSKPLKPAKADTIFKASGITMTTADGALQATISPESGALLAVDSMFPSRENISQGLYASCQVDGKEYEFVVNDGRTVKSLPECPVDIKTTYSIENDRVTVNATFTAKHDVDKPIRLLLRSKFDSDAWPHIIYYTSPKKRYPSTRPNLLWFGEDDNDLSRNVDLLIWQGGEPILPFITLEREDRYIVAGPLDVSSSATLSPNEGGAYAPSVERNPKTLKAGQSYELSLTFGNVPRRGHGYKDFADAVGWYMGRCYSNNKLTKDLFAWNQPARHPPEEGNMWSYAGKLWRGNAKMSDEEWIAAREKDLEETFTKYLWFYGWHSTDETYPTEGEYYVFRNYKHTNVEETRQEVRRLQAKGLKVCMYFRPFAMAELASDHKPPYKKWLATDHSGETITYDRGVSFAVPEALQDKIGSDKLTWSHLELGDDDCRIWFTDQVKQALEFYRPDGVSWDMGWGGTKLGHAALRVQADIYQWIAEHHPEMVVIGNGDGSPSSLFEDMILVENTQVGSGNPEAKSPLDYVAVNAFKSAASGVDKEYLIGYVSRQTGRDQHELHTELSLRTLGLGVTIGYPVNYPQLKEAHQFSATLMNVPYQMFGIKALPFSENVDASLWAGNGKCRGAVFNNSWKPVEQTIEVSWEHLRMAGDGPLQVTWRLLDVNGPVGEAQRAEITANSIWKGTIPAKSLLVLTVEEVR